MVEAGRGNEIPPKSVLSTSCRPSLPSKVLAVIAARFVATLIDCEKRAIVNGLECNHTTLPIDLDVVKCHKWKNVLCCLNHST